MSSAFQWIEYAIITNIVLKYYEGATELAIAWTSMIYMLSYIPLMFVATWMLDNWGLRKILLFGATLNAVGSLIKIGSVSPNLFFVSFLGNYEVPRRLSMHVHLEHGVARKKMAHTKLKPFGQVERLLYRVHHGTFQISVSCSTQKISEKRK